MNDVYRVLHDQTVTNGRTNGGDPCVKGNLVGLLTRASLKDKKLRPKAGAPSLDKKGRLLCGAAIGTREARVSRPLTLIRQLCTGPGTLWSNSHG